MFLDQFGTLERREHGTGIYHPSVRQVVLLDFREEVDRARGEVEGLAAAPSAGSPRPAVSVDRTRAGRRRPVGAQGL
jgi:hypothetical protein